MGKNKKGNAGSGKILGVLMGLFLLTVLLVCAACFYVRVEQATITVEAGEELDTAPERYFQTSNLALSFFSPRESGVDTSTVGDYTLHYSYLHFFDYGILVHVVDTTPPLLTLKETETGVAPGNSILAKELVAEVSDVADDEVTVTFSSGEDTCYFGTYGNYTETVTAVDDSGNKSEAEVLIHVADAPVITAPSVYYVEAGKVAAPEEFLSSVEAEDAQDREGIREALEFECNVADFSAPGDYNAVISATNSYFVTTRVTVPVHVVEKEGLTEALVADSTALFQGEILTEDVGAEADILAEPDLEAARAELEKTAVSIYFELGNGGYAYGNGFVIDLTEDAVYIASNYHVLYAFEPSARITFYNGESTSDYTLVGGNEADDVAFIRIDKSALSEETFAYLREPEISMARVRTITEGEALFRDSIYVNKRERFETGSFTEYAHEIFNGSIYTTFTVYVKQGDSGSAIFDAYGYLISMCAGVDYENGKNVMCGVRLERIVADYEQYTGNVLYAY